MATREAVVSEALSWLTTPYHHAARLKGIGVDCAMYLLEVYRAAGAIPNVRLKQYPSDWHHHRNEEKYLNMVKRFAKKIDGPPLPGDIAMYKFGLCTAHGAIVIEWPQIIHAYLSAKCVTLDDGLANSDIAERFMGFYRLKEWM